MVTDGLGREIETAVPMANTVDQTLFKAEALTSSYQYDNYGRVKRYNSGKGADPVVRREFHEDAQGRPNAGLLAKVEHGVLGDAKFSYEPDYDDAYNVEEERKGGRR